MPYPARLKAFMESGDRWCRRELNAFAAGAYDFGVGLELKQGAQRRGFSARTAEGDAYESGWFLAEESLSKTELKCTRPLPRESEFPDPGVYVAGNK